MDQFSNADKAEVIEMYIKNNKSVILTQREYRRVKNSKKAPCANSILRWYEKFKTGTLGDQRKGKSGAKKTVVTPENADQVRRQMTSDPGLSNRQASSKMGISTTSYRRILDQLNTRPNKTQTGQKIPTSSSLSSVPK